MKQEELKQLSTEDLKKKIKDGKFGTNLLFGIVIALFLAVLYRMVANGEFYSMILVPLALLITVFANYKQIKAMQQELDQRGE